MIIVANWKANLEDISKFTLKGEGVEVVVASPFPKLSNGAQDVSQFPTGAYTGEVPAEMLRDLGVKYCLVGHSERRKYLGETTAIVEKKMERLLECGLIPIVCAQTFEEIPELCKNVPGEKFLVMYEPFEAISKEGQYNAVMAEKVSAIIQEWQAKLPTGVKFLYGGSVNSGNVGEYLELVSGFVVGHASLDPEEFSKIVEQCSHPQTNS